MADFPLRLFLPVVARWSSLWGSFSRSLLRPGKTFKYTEKGPEGLLRGKKVYLVLARSGVCSQGIMQSLNFQDPNLKAVLEFIGLADVEVIAAEGVAFGPEAAEESVNAALCLIATAWPL